MRKQKSIRQPEFFFDATTRSRRLPKIGEQLLEAGIPVPCEEYAFAAHVGRQWRFDWCWPEFKVAYEREGATWGKRITAADGNTYRVAVGRHTTGKGVDGDAEKYNRAATFGWVVIRGTASTERNGQAIRDLVNALHARGWRGPTR